MRRVVVGTVIDPTWQSDTRTVVATGSASPSCALRVRKPAAFAPAPTMRVVRQKSPMAPTDYAMLDRPTVRVSGAVATV